MTDEPQKEILLLFEYLGLEPPTIAIWKDDILGINIITIKTKAEVLFLDNNKELLHALNTILKIRLEKTKKADNNFILDINGKQVKFIKEAKQKAQIAYTRVLQYNKPYEFGYLSGFERMIIHSFLKEKNEVKTTSYGEGKERRLVVSIRNAQEGEVKASK